MIQFNSLIQALNYREYCPLCQSQLTIDKADFVERLEYPSGHPYQRFAFSMGKNSNDVLYINPYTEQVEIKLVKPSYDMTVHGGSDYFNQTPTYRPFQPSVMPTVYNGVLIQRLIKGCNQCCQFSYCLQLYIDLSSYKLTGVFLNSETISFDEKDITHEIKNIYSTKRTEYFRASEHSKREKIITLPLITLDLKHPEKTLERIKTLVIFS